MGYTFSKGDTLTFSSSSTKTFTKTYATGAKYTVYVTSQPSAQACTPTYSTGTITSNVTVNAACATEATRALGTISGVSSIACSGSIKNGVCQQMTVSCPSLPDVQAYVKTVAPTGTPLGTTQGQVLRAFTGHGKAVYGVALFAVAMYVGYFGAAAGVMLLVVLSMMIDESLVTVNAVKNAVSGMANATAAVCFALFGDVRWVFVAPLAAGFLAGGWIGPKIVRKVPAEPFRVVVSLCGVGLAVWLGISAYR